MTKEETIKTTIESQLRVKMSDKELGANVVRLADFGYSLATISDRINKSIKWVRKHYKIGVANLPKTKTNLLNLLKRHTINEIIALWSTDSIHLLCILNKKK